MNKMIPSEIIHADKNGNAVIGKNLEIKGTTKLSGGLEPIHTYNYNGTKVEIFIESELNTNEFSFLGRINNSYITIGYYVNHNGVINQLKYLVVDETGLYYNNDGNDIYFTPLS